MLIITFSEIVGIVFISVIILINLGIWTHDRLKQYRCKHPRYYENRACDAICSDCGKKLGFIGDIREQRNSLNETNV